MKNNDCNEFADCGGRREFLVKAGGAAGLLVLSLGGSKAVSAGQPSGDDELVVKLSASSALSKIGGTEIFETKVGKVIVVRTDEAAYSAFDAKCTHKGGPLKMDAATNQLVCPWHGSRFEAVSGAVKKGPAETGLTSHSTTTAVVVSLT